MNGGWGIAYEITLRWTPLDRADDTSGNCLVPLGNKPLSEPLLTQIYVAMASPGLNEFKTTLLYHTTDVDKTFLTIVSTIRMDV